MERPAVLGEFDSAAAGDSVLQGGVSPHAKYLRIRASIAPHGARTGLLVIVTRITAPSISYRPSIGPTGDVPENRPPAASPENCPPSAVISDPTRAITAGRSSGTGMSNGSQLRRAMSELL